ncbi:ATP-binding protein [Sphaerisporangium krabiense]|uniref:Anti-sigma regulatory factor (Ser/Thr protein kinase) n=1 Tax=Sphaerisporangium krabiense TaxID=763782 RepID=A0A7W8ZC01_9ACTN|nr:ATP-binding protein [Sphaerisporangium krabiense]MBB5631242.1 anti-sigma regulatory factor (Ser/Thr protein kinase) [Sphaerisporangium krabiense]
MNVSGRTPAYWPITDDLGALRREVGAFAGEAGLAGVRLQDLVLAVNEAAANVLDHAEGRGHVIAWHDGQFVTVEIHDRLGLLVPAHANAPDPGVGTLRGRGLWLMRQLCDEVYITKDERGSTVRLRQAIAGPPGGAGE